jgi:hypothetical protein
VPEAPPLPPPDVLDELLDDVALLVVPVAPDVVDVLELLDMVDVLEDELPLVLDVLDVELPLGAGVPVDDSPQAISHQLVHKGATTKASFRMSASSRDLRRK